MRRLEVDSKQEEGCDLSSNHISSGEESSADEQIGTLEASDSKIEELHRSVSRLREFVAAIPAQKLQVVHPSVEEYCDKMMHYRIKTGDSVLQIAQRRVNKMLRNRKIKRNWNNDDITLLVWLVSQQIDLSNLSHFDLLVHSSDIQQRHHWEQISALIAGSTWQKCKYRWLSLKKVKLVAHKWSAQESRLLKEAVSKADKIHWKLVSEWLYENNPSRNKVFRTAKQCREHWNCFLNPNIQKGPWSLQEDKKLLQYVLELEGSKKWSQISKFMEGRTENALKNRFNLLVSRQRKISGHLTEKRLMKSCLNKLMLQQGDQEPFQLQTPNAPFPQTEENIEQIDQTNRDPIIPIALQQAAFPCDNMAAGGTSFVNLANFMSGMSSLTGCDGLGQNTVYFGFLFPSHFM